jgi:squalene-hopene/tetraprenyl-beta-curcumene cyclase
VTTLSVNALAAARDLDSLDTADRILEWLLKQQYTERHPYTGADPGGWAWTDLAGGVPDCDDTPGVQLALSRLIIRHPRMVETPAEWLDKTIQQMIAATRWMEGLQNRDGGFPTFCRGWGTLPFDRSGSDLTAHALRTALGEPSTKRGLAYLAREQRPDGSWLPLWFGNQHAPDDINPVYGTARVLAAYRDLGREDAPECQRGVAFLLSVQNADGGWGGAKDCPSSVEETALAVEVLLELATTQDQVQRGIAWLVEAVESGRFRDPSPIGFYFAKLWYYEKLYPLIFTVAALGRACRSSPGGPDLTSAAGSA